MIAGSLLAIVLAALFSFDQWPSGHAGHIYISLHLAMTAAMLVAWASPTLRMRDVLALAIVFRLALIFVAPISSNDIERYLWDGAVAINGFDPYTVSPDNPLVSHLRTSWPTPEEHAKYPTLYPPGALMVFAFSALGGPVGGALTWKVIAALSGILGLFVMKAVLEHFAQARHFALFALSPLLVLETGVGAHLDSLLVLGITLILYAFAKGRWAWLGVALGWTICVKFLPIVLLAPLFFALTLRDYAKVFIACTATIVVIYGSAFALDYVPIGIIVTFFEKWRFTSPLYQLLELGFGPSMVIWPITVLAALGVGLSCWIARNNPFIGFAVVLSVPLLLSPVVFPWYLMVLVPFMAIRPSLTLLLWTSAVPLSYIVLNRWLGERVWEPAVWPMFAIGSALSFGLLFDYLSKRSNDKLDGALRTNALVAD